MRLPLLTKRINRRDLAHLQVGDGISPSDCNCGYDCQVCEGPRWARVCWDDPTCLARAAACRAGCASCNDKCTGWHEAASQACGAAIESGPGYVACKVAADAAYIDCKSKC